MKTKSVLKLVAALLLLLTLNPQFSSCFAQGSLTPPGAPAPTMKTLDQLEPRTPISSGPYTIAVPGSYCLTANITVSTNDAITIAANNVTLDLGGFTISSTAASATGYGIKLSNGSRDITISNGHIRGGVTNDGTGNYSGSGFAFGIGGESFDGPLAAVNVLVSRVSVCGCLYVGIMFNQRNSTVVEFCTATTAGMYGISASTVKSCAAIDCGRCGIGGDQVSDCFGECNLDDTEAKGVAGNTVLNCQGLAEKKGSGVEAMLAQNCYGFSKGGVGVGAVTAENCYGYSGGSGAYGISASIAHNCHGLSYTNIGLYASFAANNCYGQTGGSGNGLVAPQAQNCYGFNYTGPGNGLVATNAFNCYGASGSGIGILAATAQNCYGASGSGTGLSATIANTCIGSRSGGTAIQANIGVACYAAAGTNNIANKYNMP
ncbi:MAG: hypothetical protein WCK89_07650 [bacterium]